MRAPMFPTRNAQRLDRSEGKLQIRMSHEERARLRAWAADAGMTTADAVRVALDRLVRMEPEKFRRD